MQRLSDRPTLSEISGSRCRRHLRPDEPNGSAVRDTGGRLRRSELEVTDSAVRVTPCSAPRARRATPPGAAAPGSTCRNRQPTWKPSRLASPLRSCTAPAPPAGAVTCARLHPSGAECPAPPADAENAHGRPLKHTCPIPMPGAEDAAATLPLKHTRPTPTPGAEDAAATPPLKHTRPTPTPGAEDAAAAPRSGHKFRLRRVRKERRSAPSLRARSGWLRHRAWNDGCCRVRYSLRLVGPEMSSARSVRWI
ncbi:hypothetical protein J2S44_006065 [Catenuloplanes niger]|uniref:Uncharacterized protein n=1 Tax=Catenuloplanes niger TaxID=587534 RepID=A0AAE3ZXU5_9ACTN|nr:hypothetical protein [Catenuloplanes niger]